MKQYEKYIPILVLSVIVLIVVVFFVRNFLTIVAGFLIILIVYISIVNENFRKTCMELFKSVSKKMNEFYEKNIKK